MLAQPIQLPDLPYAYTALEPCISEETLRFHHDKHMAAYVNNLNDTLEGCPKCASFPLEQLILRAPRFPRRTATALINNAGGVYNHRFYFESMSAEHDQPVPDALRRCMERQFITVEQFTAQFKKQAMGVFGSGWLWLCWSRRTGLELIPTQNQLTTLGMGVAPLLCVDVWEHAYYLQFQNRRAEYLDAFFHVVDWRRAAQRLAAAHLPA